jgi:2-haloalkanoic acid dehalogenase type II
MSNDRPVLLTFDVFGTVLDWRSGLRELDDAAFERCIDLQGEMEQRAYRRYSSIVEESLLAVGLAADRAKRHAAGAGRWPLYPDSADALRRLQSTTTCAAITNSDRAHGEDVQAQLGFRLGGWICAEDVRAYKPDRRMWEAAAARLGVPFGRGWCHISAYADYDLATARELGLTCVFVRRPHCRPGDADVTVDDLAELAELVTRSCAPPSG